MFESRLFEVVVYPESFDCSDLKDMLDSFSFIKQYAYNLHNKEGKEHYHIMFQCFDALTSERVAKEFNVSENAVEKPKSKKKTHKFDDMLLYLIHRNSPEKYQYDASCVVANFDYMAFLQKKENESSVSARKSEIIDLIQSGVIKEYNLSQYVTSYEFVKFERVIRSAFAYREKMLKNSSRDMRVIYICGTAGSGKTTYAKKIAADKNMDYFISSSSNDIFYGYGGQPCVILDDLRGFSFDFSDLLKLLDNNTNTTVKSRYNNKNLCDVKLLILTTSLELPDFVKSVMGCDGEDIKQIKRRIGTYIRMTKDYFYVSSWLPEVEKYSDEIPFRNNIVEQFVESVPKVSSLDFLGLSLSDSVVADEFVPCCDGSKIFGGAV